MKPEIKAGQEWRKADNNREGPTRIRVLDVRHRGQNLTVATVTPDGRLIRERHLLGSALTNTRGGYRLVTDAPPEAKAATIHPAACGKCGGMEAHLAPCPVGVAQQDARGGIPPAAPSPLEVVRRVLDRAIRGAPVDQYDAAAATNALATLEESTRADAMDNAARHMESRAADIERGGGLTAEWMARVFRDEAKTLRGK